MPGGSAALCGRALIGRSRTANLWSLSQGPPTAISEAIGLTGREAKHVLTRVTRMIEMAERLVSKASQMAEEESL